MTIELRLMSICRKNGLQLSDQQIAKLRTYGELLLEWNSKINLISRKDAKNIWFSHILHSLSVLFFVQFPKDFRVLDLGTGGGLPGIPIAIVRDDLKLTLCDSIRKKTMAVQEMVDRLQLANTNVVTARAEEMAKDRTYTNVFDAVIARAVAPLDDLIEWSKPLATKKRSMDFPKLIALKGGILDEEIREATRKSTPPKIEARNLVFDGSVEMGLEGKKIVLVYF